MRVFGLDFTSRPRRKKPLTCAVARLQATSLVVERVERWPSFDEFEEFLDEPGPWIIGADFPFGLPRRFLENQGWPLVWADGIAKIAGLERRGFRHVLEAYRSGRAAGDREHRRATDRRAGSVSPQKLHGVPVALMLFEGAQRLWRADVDIPPVRRRSSERIAIEAYPGMLVRTLLGRTSYKHDDPKRQTDGQREARQQVVDALRTPGSAFQQRYGFTVELDAGDSRARDQIVDDPMGDGLDAILCACQAAWAWERRDVGFGVPETADAAFEGWIVDPALLEVPR